MPWPFLFLAGTKVVGHVATTAATKTAATWSAKGAVSAGAKGSAAKSNLHLPPGTKTVAKEFIKRLGRRIASANDDRDDDNEKK